VIKQPVSANVLPDLMARPVNNFVRRIVMDPIARISVSVENTDNVIHRPGCVDAAPAG